MRYLVLSVGYMHRFYRISMGLRVPASSGIDNREASYESFFWRLVSDLAVPDYSMVTFSGCGAFLGITVPTLCHQLVPEGWRLLAALPVNWTVTFIHPVKEFLQRCYWNVSKGPLSVPYLPHYQPQAVDVCLGAVDLRMEHFRCHINRCSRIGTGDVYFCFSQAHVSNLHCVFVSQLQWDKEHKLLEGRSLTNRPQFSMVYTLTDHRNDVIKCSKLKWFIWSI